MIYGLYLSAQGADVQSMRQDVIANNLANASTNAFKRDFAVFQAHPPADQNANEELPGNLGDSTGGISLAEVATDFSNGPLVRTGGTFDLALSGPGFLQVTDGQQQFLTRNGQLARNTLGELVTHESGHAVLGSDGVPITIPAEAEQIEVASDGTVFQIGPGNSRSELGKLDIVRPTSFDQLVKVGNSLYRSAADVEPAGEEVQVQQGFLESSGTRPVLEMMDLIEASRAFEANVNMIKFQDDTLGQLLQTLPRR